jgi:hypothetical protein
MEINLFLFICKERGTLLSCTDVACVCFLGSEVYDCVSFLFCIPENVCFL